MRSGVGTQTESRLTWPISGTPSLAGPWAPNEVAPKAKTNASDDAMMRCCMDAFR